MKKLKETDRPSPDTNSDVPCPDPLKFPFTNQQGVRILAIQFWFSWMENDGNTIETSRNQPVSASNVVNRITITLFGIAWDYLYHLIPPISGKLYINLGGTSLLGPPQEPLASRDQASRNVVHGVGDRRCR